MVFERRKSNRVDVGPFFVALLRLKGRHRVRRITRSRQHFGRRHFTWASNSNRCHWMLVLASVLFGRHPNGRMSGIQGHSFSRLFHHVVSSAAILYQTGNKPNEIGKLSTTNASRCFIYDSYLNCIIEMRDSLFDRQ